MNTTKWIRASAVAGVATIAFATGRSARSVSTIVSPEKKALLTELEKACIAASSRTAKEAAADCQCLKSYHEESTEDRYLRSIIASYAGRESYDSPGISDDLSIALENDATALDKCTRDPAWFRRRLKKGAP